MGPGGKDVNRIVNRVEVRGEKGKVEIGELGSLDGDSAVGNLGCYGGLFSCLNP